MPTPRAPRSAPGPSGYRIRVMGHLGPQAAAWFDGLTLTNLPGGEAELAGDIADQAALHGVLLKVRDLGLPLLSVRPVRQRKAGRPSAPRRRPPPAPVADGGPDPAW
jgi:hypothetical protein